jgi:hypothetical protein
VRRGAGGGGGQPRVPGRQRADHRRARRGQLREVAIHVAQQSIAGGAHRAAGRLPAAAGGVEPGQLLHTETEAEAVADNHQRKDAIAYAFESTPHGARVRIRTADPEALRAAHVFLRYQIAEHKTGDSTAVK